MIKIKSVLKIFFLCFIYLVLGIVFTYPLINNLNSKIPNNLYKWEAYNHEWGDHLQVVAGFKEEKNILKNILKGEQVYEKENCLGRIEECEADGLYILRYLVFSPYHLHLFLSFFASDILAYNLVILTTFVLIGYSSFLLSKLFVSKDSKYPNLIAFIASLFTLLPAKALHHQLVGQRIGWMFPVYLFLVYFFELILRNKYKSKKNKIFVISAFLFLAVYLGFNDVFLSYFGLIYLGLRLIFEVFIDYKSGKKLKKYMKYIWSVIGILVIIFSNIIIRIQAIASSSISSGRPMDVVNYHSPPVHNLVLNKIVNHEQNVYIGLGIVVIFMALIYILYSIFKRIKFNREFTKKDLFISFLFISALFFIVISLGTTTPIYEFLYKYLPAFKFSRTPTRSILIVFPLISLLFIVLVEGRVGELIKKSGEKFVVGLLISFVFIQILAFYPGKVEGFSDLPERIETFENKKILFIPYVESGDYFNSYYEYYLSDTNALSVNGYHPYVGSEVEEFEKKYAEKINSGKLLTEEIDDFMSEYSIDYIILNKELYAQIDGLPMMNLLGLVEVDERLLQSDLRLISDDGRVMVFTKRDSWKPALN